MLMLSCYVICGRSTISCSQILQSFIPYEFLTSCQYQSIRSLWSSWSSKYSSGGCGSACWLVLLWRGRYETKWPMRLLIIPVVTSIGPFQKKSGTHAPLAIQASSADELISCMHFSSSSVSSLSSDK
jgi:hypothetical protein